MTAAPLARRAGPLRAALGAAADLCAGTPGEVARGVALGAWFGLLPWENAAAAAVGLAVVVVRLNLPAAALAATVATGLSPVLDPALHRLGWALLTAEPLRGTFAALLALPGGAWSGLDNTVTLAALLIGAAAAWPLHRAALAAHRIVAAPPPVTPEEPGPLSRRYLLPRAGLAAGLGACLAFGSDPLIGRSVTARVGRAAGVRADLAGVRTSFVPPRLELDGFALPDRDRPGRNLVAFDRLTADVDPGELLRGRLHVTGGTLTGLTFGEPRDPPAEGLDPPCVPLVNPADLLPVCDGLLDARGALGDLPALLADGGNGAAGSLETVRLARRLRGEWGARLDGLAARGGVLAGRSDELSDRLNAAAATGADPLVRLRRLAEVAAEARALAADAEALRGELPALKARAAADRAALAAAKGRDAARLRTAAAAGGNPDAAARALLGPALSRRLTATLAVARWLRDRLGGPGAFAEPPAPRRGVRVPFPPANPRPAVLLEHLAVTGLLPTAAGPVPFAGTLTGLTTDPALAAGPVAGSLTNVADSRKESLSPGSGDNAGDSRPPRFTVAFAHDAAAGAPVTDVDVRVRADIPAGATLFVGPAPVGLAGAADGEPAAVEWAARLRLTGRGSGAAVRGAVDLRIAGRAGVGAPEPAGVPPELVRAVNLAAAESGELRGTLHLSGSAARPDWRLDTDAGERLVAALRGGAERAAAGRTAALLAEADAAEARFLADLSHRWAGVAGGVARLAAAAQQLGGVRTADVPANPLIQSDGGVRRTAARVPADTDRDDAGPILGGGF